VCVLGGVVKHCLQIKDTPSLFPRACVLVKPGRLSMVQSLLPVLPCFISNLEFYKLLLASEDLEVTLQERGRGFWEERAAGASGMGPRPLWGSV
jgi:hypothetical protein